MQPVQHGDIDAWCSKHAERAERGAGRLATGASPLSCFRRGREAQTMQPVQHGDAWCSKRATPGGSLRKIASQCLLLHDQPQHADAFERSHERHHERSHQRSHQRSGRICDEPFES